MPFKVPLSKPDITKQEVDAVQGVLKTLSLSLGPRHTEFENMVAKFAGVKHAIAVNSGTSALHLIVRALGITAGDEVITTPFSFIASSNCILYEGAAPVFADIEAETFNIDVAGIEKKITKKTKAILAVDVFSHPAHWAALDKIAKKHKLFLIEDSAEALGSTYRGKPCGSFGDAAVFAFYPNKQITTGEGGMVLTNSAKIAAFCRSAANQGRRTSNGKWLEHVQLGYNYRLDEMSSALGIAQMRRVREIIQKRRQVAAMYQKALEGIEGLRIPFTSPESTLSWFVYVVILPPHLAGTKRDGIIKKMAGKGIQCSNYFQPIHLQPFYRRQFGYAKGDYPVAEDISRRTLALPFFSSLSQREIATVVKALKECLPQ